MRRTRVVWVGATIASFAVFVGGVTYLAVRSSDARAADTTSVDLPDLLVQGATVSVTGPPASVPLGLSAPIRVSVLEDSEAVQLFDGGVLVAETSVGEGGAATLDWPALSVGPHLLTVQVIDDAEHRASSAPVAVEVRGTAGPPVPTPVQVLPGEGVTDVATRLGIDEAAISAGDGGSAIVTLQGDERVVPGVTGDGPLDITIDECAVSLALEGVKETDQVGVASAGRPGYVQVPRRSDGTFGPITLPGGSFSVAAKRGSMTEPQGLTLPESCTAADLWKGDASIIDGTLRIPAPTRDFYLYLGVDDEPFVRIPADDSAVLQAPSAQVDVSQLLPALEGSKVHLEVWRRVGGSAELFASGTATIPKGGTVAGLIGEPSALDLVVITPNGFKRSFVPEDDRELTFLWTAASPRVDRVVYQVLANPLSTDNRSLAPPVLLMAGVSEISPGSAGTGSFTLDTLDIPQANEPPPKIGSQTAPKPTPLVSIPSVAELLAEGKTVSAGPLQVEDVAKLDDATKVEQALVGLGPAARGQVWVRVLPFDGAMALGDASTNVTIGLPADTTDSLRLHVDSATLTVGAAPDPAFKQCVQVTVPWDDPPQTPVGSGLDDDPDPFGSNDANALVVNAAAAFYPHSGTWCAGDFAPDDDDDDCGYDPSCYLSEGLEAAGAGFEFVAETFGPAWDQVAGAYNGVIDAVATVFAVVNPLCVAAGQASDDAAASCQTWSKVAAKVAIAAVLAAYGIPPSLPTSDALEAVAQGDMERLAVELMKSLGVPCDDLAAGAEAGPAVQEFAKEAGVGDPTVDGKVDPCLAVARMLVEKVKSEVRETTSVQVAAATGLPYFSGISGFWMVPDPRGVLQPARLDVTTTLVEPKAALGRTCNVTVAPDPLQPSPFAGATGVLTEDWGYSKPQDGIGTWSASFPLTILSQTGLPPDQVKPGTTISVRLQGGPCLGDLDTKVSATYSK